MADTTAHRHDLDPTHVGELLDIRAELTTAIAAIRRAHRMVPDSRNPQLHADVMPELMDIQRAVLGFTYLSARTACLLTP